MRLIWKNPLVVNIEGRAFVLYSYGFSIGLFGKHIWLGIQVGPFRAKGEKTLATLVVHDE